MAHEEDRSFSPSRAQANRARSQGSGMGQKEMDLQRDPNRRQTGTAPERTEPFDTGLEPTHGEDRAGEAEFGDTDVANAGDEAARAEPRPRRDAWGLDPNRGRDEAGIDDVEGDLGAGTPANVDMRKLGQEDRPQEDWGEPAAEGTMHSANHTRRAVKTEAERSQGRKTRTRNKDIVSRRP